MVKLYPFFCYYGGKWRAAPHYPKPNFELIIEPFAGAAGYSTRYPDHKVVLIDKDPTLVGLWKYLIKVSKQEILSLPTVIPSTVDALPINQEAKWLIGFWCNKGSSGPANQPSSWMKSQARPNSYWGENIRNRIAYQVEHIKHWKAMEMDYINIQNQPATWFVDPPYEVAGQHYRCKFKDYNNLANWCKTREGQVLVCEQQGAEWLPFQPFKTIQTTPGKNGKTKSNEVIWIKET